MAKEDLEVIVSRAQLMRESLSQSQSLTDNMLRVLGSFDQRLTSLQKTMQPIQSEKSTEKSESSTRTKQKQAKKRDSLGFLSDEDLDTDDADLELIEEAQPSRRKSSLELFSDSELEDKPEEEKEDEDVDKADSSPENFLTRTHAIRRAHDNIDQTISAAETILKQFDVSRQVEPKIMEGPRDDLSTYLGAVDRLKTNVDFFNFHRSFQTSDAAFKHARNLLLKAMAKLEEKFRETLKQNSLPIDPPRLLATLPSAARPPNAFGAAGEGLMVEKVLHAGSGADSARFTEDTPLPLPMIVDPKAVRQLADMAQRMVEASHHQLCIKAYREIRSSALEDSLKKLGVEKVTKDDVQKMPWEVLEGKIASWIQFMKISVKLLFAAERKTCDQVFYHLDPHRDQCLLELLEPNFNMVMSFGDSVAKSRRSPEKLFVLLDMYELMRDLLPEIDVIFSGEATAPLRESAALLFKRLAVAAQETFNDFHEAVEKDSTKTPVLDGTVHPLTSYVVNYVKFLFDYQKTIRQLYKEPEDMDEKQSHIGQSTFKIMEALLTNLDAKAKQYKDPALMSIFLMNNIHYIVRSVMKSEAKDLLGDDWIQVHRRIVQQHASAYQRSAWAKVLQCLSAQGLSSSSGGALGATPPDASGVSRSVLKERFKNFNTMLEDLHQKQSQWSIPDAELREAVRLAVEEVLSPAYINFLKRYSSALEGGKNPHKYIKYSPHDLERMLAEFFEGKARKSQLFQS